MVDRTATTVWSGELRTGSGQLTLDSSGAGGTFDVSFPRRAGDPDGQTSPEELIAAAHSSCYAMQLSALLGGAGTAPEKLETSAVVTLGQAEGGGYEISSVALRLVGTVPGASAEDFEKAAQAAKEQCPVSKALAGTDITLDASLA